MKISLDEFIVKPKDKVKLDKWPTLIKPFAKTKQDYQLLLQEHIKQLGDLQRLQYASNQYALLLIFQGMDASGKDGSIRHVMSGVNPQGCQVYSFKQPSALELQHDFLWRTTCCLPERGRVGIFNRSYYEEVLIVRVHPKLLLNQNLPSEILNDKNLWQNRFDSIVNFEEHLYNSGTQVVKFFLHLSQEEQKKRFLSRIDDPDKNWKLNVGDFEERKFWPDYMNAYEECLRATSTKHAPWYVIPADDKENARLIISQTIVNTLQALNMRYPVISPERQQELNSLKKEL